MHTLYSMILLKIEHQHIDMQINEESLLAMLMLFNMNIDYTADD